jgi:hypothetical protein
MDFCDASSNLSPTSQFYGVSHESNLIGSKAINELDFSSCKIILPGQENNEHSWSNVKTFLNNFQCVRLQGFNK